MMKEQSFITAKELAEMLNISTGHAYKVIHRLNDELTQNPVCWRRRRTATTM